MLREKNLQAAEEPTSRRAKTAVIRIAKARADGADDAVVAAAAAAFRTAKSAVARVRRNKANPRNVLTLKSLRLRKKHGRSVHLRATRPSSFPGNRFPSISRGRTRLHC